MFIEVEGGRNALRCFRARLETERGPDHHHHHRRRHALARDIGNRKTPGVITHLDEVVVVIGEIRPDLNHDRPTQGRQSR